MSRSQDPHKTFLPFGNPFRMMKAKGSNLSPKLLDLLNTFEETLSARLNKLKPANKKDVLSFSWMKAAIESLCGIHADIKVLITALELPVCDWDDKWIDVYLDNSVKLLDICIAFTSEISRLKQGRLFLQCALHSLTGASSNKFVSARSSLDGWRKHVGSKNPKLENCFSVMESLARTLDLPKIKNSSKGKVLMRAMYGVKAVTLFVCSAFAAALSGSAKSLSDVQVSETYLWGETFADLQTFVNTEIRNSTNGSFAVLKEIEDVVTGVEKLYPVVRDCVGVGPVGDEELMKCTLDLEKSTEKFADGLNLLGKEVDGFFQVVLTGRDALLCNLRVGGDVFDQMRTNHRLDGQAVR
ncbi:hypothetical protein MIMGU_mgv1a009082mg [Erythranthe guttata]|uniref:Uncharacterized protein n=1 Tax=Erythranthe guttata TaxID=4155 RepID=A0A022R619_ERYGU|nr:PREDICTED: protein BPS1, chloroplastic-like [Erythranthe guttata]XP_012840206.1 PREDICTED: protein BPS1, chloroplastic-like [Erythranthe guttata]EYU35102.1 hypothetical protein MIMGU_mgv1a009082mg [Erythranthe guttata]EYU35103.1 hypothetical protein MIMGU_mgv1a009082mg [Erythranthe guttata]|eukprot:XP_012840205.1 PREDICTED: protein BPS1, chloroplastic-like [Erythranthe guttata]